MPATPVILSTAEDEDTERDTEGKNDDEVSPKPVVFNIDKLLAVHVIFL